MLLIRRFLRWFLSGGTLDAQAFSISVVEQGAAGDVEGQAGGQLGASKGVATVAVIMNIAVVFILAASFVSASFFAWRFGPDGVPNFVENSLACSLGYVVEHFLPFGGCNKFLVLFQGSSFC